MEEEVCPAHQALQLCPPTPAGCLVGPPTCHGGSGVTHEYSVRVHRLRPVRSDHLRPQRGFKNIPGSHLHPRPRGAHNRGVTRRTEGSGDGGVGAQGATGADI